MLHESTLKIIIQLYNMWVNLEYQKHDMSIWVQIISLQWG